MQSIHAVVLDRISNNYLNTYWMETGFNAVSTRSWVSVTTHKSSFSTPIVLASLPDYGNQAATGNNFPVAVRVRNVVVTSGVTSFDYKLYVPNDTFCLTTWASPTHVPATQVSWMVVEKGAYYLSTTAGATTGVHFVVLSGSINRPSTDVASDFFAFSYPMGCGSSTTQCTFPSSVNKDELAAIAQIQTLNNDFFMFARTKSLSRSTITLALCVHDTTTPSYYIVNTFETIGMLVVTGNVQFVCTEGLSFETFRQVNVTYLPFQKVLAKTYVQVPGVYGMLLTYVSLTDSTNARTYSTTTTSFYIVTQEDQCYDEQQVHETKEDVGAFALGATTSAPEGTCFMDYNAPPTMSPTPTPTVVPSLAPSPTPTRTPTFSPTRNPTNTPTLAPTGATGTPSLVPTRAPSATPTFSPTRNPTQEPTSIPTRQPTVHVTAAPSTAPNETCITVLMYDLFGDGWGTGYLEIQGKGLLYENPSSDYSLLPGTYYNRSATFQLNCSCGVVSVCSRHGYMNASIAFDPNDVVRHPWEMLWEYVDSTGYRFIGDVNSMFESEFDVLVNEEHQLNYNATDEDNACDRCPHKKKPPGPKGPPSSPGAGEHDHDHDHNATDADGGAGSSSGGADAGGNGDGKGPGDQGPGAGRGKVPPPPPPPALVEIDLFDISTGGWYENRDAWDAVCGDDVELLLPRVLTYPRYYISNEERTDLIHSGSLCLKDTKEICEEVMPHEGKFVYRVAGYYPTPEDVTWRFCGMEGGLGEELKFEMHHGKCTAIAKLSASDYCSGLESLAVFVGSLLFSGVHAGTLSTYATSVLENAIQTSVALPSAKVAVTGLVHSDAGLLVNFLLSADMRDMHMIGMYDDMVEAFSDALYAGLLSACSGGYISNLLDLKLGSGDALLSSGGSVSVSSFELQRVEYLSLSNHEVVEVAEYDVSLFTSTDVSSTVSYGSIVVGVLFVSLVVSVLAIVVNQRRRVEQQSVVESNSTDEHEKFMSLSTHSVEDLDIVDSQHRLMTRRQQL